jgi:hypothetical protein
MGSFLMWSQGDSLMWFNTQKLGPLVGGRDSSRERVGIYLPRKATLHVHPFALYKLTQLSSLSISISFAQVC